MTLEAAQQSTLNGTVFGDVYPTLESEEDRRLFKAWWTSTPNVPTRRLSSQEKRMLRINTALSGVPIVTSGNACKTCQGLMVRGGKCEYCPNGCGSEGECS